MPIICKKLHQNPVQGYKLSSTNGSKPSCSVIGRPFYITGVPPLLLTILLSFEKRPDKRVAFNRPELHFTFPLGATI